MVAVFPLLILLQGFMIFVFFIFICILFMCTITYACQYLVDLTGCLPTLATIPVWIGLYQALSNVANEVIKFDSNSDRSTDVEIIS